MHMENSGLEVAVRVEGNTAFVELNRPEVRNALNYAALQRLAAFVSELGADRSVRAVVFSGRGEAFCSGADLKERRTLSPDGVRRNVRTIREVFTAIQHLPQPTFAVLHGVALGGGFELALACDFRFAAESTSLGLTETGLAIIPGAGGTQRLARLIGPMQAKRMILAAERIDAREALRLGILTGLGSDLAETNRMAASLAETIAANGPLAVHQAKWAIDRGLDVDLATGLELESQAYEVLIPTQDRTEALAAFAEKRRPRFLGE